MLKEKGILNIDEKIKEFEELHKNYLNLAYSFGQKIINS